MTQLNDAQLKEFWEGVFGKDGVEFGTVVDGEIVCYRRTRWVAEDEEWDIEVIPRTDSLEFPGYLFKHAVPKDTDVQISTGRDLAGHVNRWVVAIKYKGKWHQGEDKNLVLALLWAIKEAMK